MKYEDIKTKHNLTDEQWQHLQQLCERGARFRPSIHVRHTDRVLHMDLFNVHGLTEIGSSWALTPEGEPYAQRGVAEL